MKKLSEIINDLSYYKAPILEKYDILDSQFYKHLQIDRLLDIEQKYDKCILFESLGTFAGSKELVKMIMDNYFSNKKDKYNRFYRTKDREGYYEIDTTNIKEFPRKFIKKLYIGYTEEPNPNNVATSGCYLKHVDTDTKKFFDISENLDMWDEKNEIFNYSIIILYDINRVSQNKLFQALLHELEHIWDDFILRTEMESSLYLKSNIYGSDVTLKLKDFLDSSLEFLAEFNIKIDKRTDFEKMSKNEIRDRVMSIIYKLDKFEAKAFIAQLSGHLEGTKFDNIKDCFSYIRKTYDPYKHYRLLYYLLNEKESSILDYIHIKNSDINKFRKISKDVWSKMLNHTYLACEKHIKPRAIREHQSILTYPINPEESIWNRISNDDKTEMYYKIYKNG